ncbi:MAG: amidohydrolase family protein [Planctomycetota bacterium]
MMIHILAVSAASSLLAEPRAIPAPPESRPFAIRADQVLRADGQSLAQGVILVEDGRIVRVGIGLDIPEAALLVEHHGTASAGLVALHSYSGAPGEMFDSTRSVLPDARVALAFDPAKGDFADALRAGITSLVLSPLPGSLCAGASALVKTSGGVVVRSEAQLSLGFSARSLRNNRFPTSFGGAITELDRLFEEPTGVFARAAKQQIPVLFEVSSREDVARAIEFAERHDLAGTVSGAAWAGELAQRLHEAELSVVCGPFRVGEERRDLLAVQALEKAGVPFGFALDAPANHPVMLRAGAAMCMREGLGRGTAWRALTSTAAKIAGAEDRIGDLAKGLDADIVLWSGDPLDLGSTVKAVYVDGKLAWKDEK